MQAFQTYLHGSTTTYNSININILNPNPVQKYPTTSLRGGDEQQKYLFVQLKRGRKK